MQELRSGFDQAREIIVRPLNELAHTLAKLSKAKLWLQVIVAIVLGLGTGLLLNPSAAIITQGEAVSLSEWLNLPGSVFLRLVQMIMIPLIITSIITGIVSNNSDQLRTMGVRLLLYFLATTTVAISIGVMLAKLMVPGEYVRELRGFSSDGTQTVIPESNGMVLSIPETISNLIPVNPHQAILTGEMLAIVIYTIIIGIAITQINTDLARPIIRVSEAI